jgi:hypothetical protein
MRAMAHSHYVSQMVRAAADLSLADLSLADHLGRERLTAAELAEREGSAPSTPATVINEAIAGGKESMCR